MFSSKKGLLDFRVFTARIYFSNQSLKVNHHATFTFVSSETSAGEVKFNDGSRQAATDDYGTAFNDYDAHSH